MLLKLHMGAKLKAYDGRTALVIGRFQPFHNGHLEATRGILGRQAKLLLVIGSAQEGRTRKNPFSGKERLEMISSCLKAHGLLARTRIILLKDENNHPRWVKRVLGIAKDAKVAYSGNWLVQSLLSPEFEVHTMKSGIKISATEIRGMIREGDRRWKKCVPKEISSYIERKGLAKAV